MYKPLDKIIYTALLACSAIGSYEKIHAQTVDEACKNPEPIHVNETKKPVLDVMRQMGTCEPFIRYLRDAEKTTLNEAGLDQLNRAVSLHASNPVIANHSSDFIHKLPDQLNQDDIFRVDVFPLELNFNRDIANIQSGRTKNPRLWEVFHKNNLDPLTMIHYGFQIAEIRAIIGEPNIETIEKYRNIQAQKGNIEGTTQERFHAGLHGADSLALWEIHFNSQARRLTSHQIKQVLKAYQNHFDTVNTSNIKGFSIPGGKVLLTRSEKGEYQSGGINIQDMQEYSQTAPYNAELQEAVVLRYNQLYGDYRKTVKEQRDLYARGSFPIAVSSYVNISQVKEQK